MSSLATWDPYNKHVQGGINQGDYVNGQFLLVCSGPPMLANLGSGIQNSVYPLGVTQNLGSSSGKNWTRIFEIGSDRSYWMPGRTSHQLTLARAWIGGPNLLRTMYAYYGDSVNGRFPQVQRLLGASAQYRNLVFPYTTGQASNGIPPNTGALPDIQVPPGYENLFMNLSSDLFNQTLGMLIVFRSAAMKSVGAMYLEQCVIPSYSWGVDSQGLIFQESIGIQYERPVPVNVNSIPLLQGLIEGNVAPSSRLTF